MIATRPPLRLPPDLQLRPVDQDDLPLLERIYAGTRQEELAQTDWDDAQKAAFLRFQFQAQHHHYITHYTEADFWVLLRAGVAIGRLYLHWRPTELRIIDIALLPEHRGGGSGGALLRALMAAALGDGRTVSIHVERTNRAQRLYHRLGFAKAGEHGIYDLMECHARPD